MTFRTAARPRFDLEVAYRTHFNSGLVDLSSSAAPSPCAGEIVDAGMLAGVSLGYEPGGGSLALRRAIAGLYRDLDAANVLITAGAAEAIRATAMALVRPNQGVIVQEPSYGGLRQAVADAGGRVVASGGDLAFINSPHGPTGAVVQDIASIAQRVVVDEVYQPIELVPGTRAASCVDVSSSAVAIGDLSKPLGLGGLRVGWIASRDGEAIERCADALDYLSGSVSSLSAAVALKALQRFDELLLPHLLTARANLSRLAAFVERHRAWVDWDAPQAGYTACLHLRAGPAPGLIEGVREDGFFLLDGAVFGMPGCLRIGLALPGEVFEAGLDVLVQCADLAVRFWP